MASLRIPESIFALASYFPRHISAFLRGDFSGSPFSLFRCRKSACPIPAEGFLSDSAAGNAPSYLINAIEGGAERIDYRTEVRRSDDEHTPGTTNKRANEAKKG